MMRRYLFLISCISLILVSASSASAALETGPMAGLCTTCHTPEKGVMMGFLENIDFNSGIIMMDFNTSKEIVRFNDSTELKYLKNTGDIANYRGEGFKIDYIKKSGDRLATKISRFDLFGVLTKAEKLTQSEFKVLRRDPRVRLYDVRPLMKYRMGHIPGAEAMPAYDFEKFIDKLPADRSTPVIFYGAGGCLSPTAFIKARGLGYSNIRIYTGGFTEWSRNEYSTVSVDWLSTAIAMDIPHVLIDLRPDPDVSISHIKGAVSIEYKNLAESRGMFPANKNALIIFYGSNSEKAAGQAIYWGYRAVNILPIEFADWGKRGYPVEHGPARTDIVYSPKPLEGTISVKEFEQIAARAPETIQVIDVRNADEWNAGAISGALNIPLGELENRLDELDRNKELIFYCSTGIRAEMAYSLTKKQVKKSRYLNTVLSFENNRPILEEQ